MVSDTGSVQQGRRRRNRDCFAPASVLFRCPPVAAERLHRPAFQLTLDYQVGATGGGGHVGGVRAIRLAFRELEWGRRTGVS